MKTTTIIAALFLALFYATPAQSTITFDWATVGNPGNAGETDVHGDSYGGVGYSYNISKTEVTNTQYTEFLNAVAGADPHGLYNASMGSDTRGGIIRTGSSPNYTYEVKPDSIGNGPGGADGDDYAYGDKPVVFVSFFDAMRFVNWLEHGQPVGPQGPATTEEGVYAIGDGLSETRASGATYFIPSEDEWYKAAYHKNDGVTSNYWEFPTSTDLVPNNNLPSSDTGNSANFQWNGYTTGDFSYPMTAVGAYSLSASPYGTFDQGGNVWEWNESVRLSAYRGRRGGYWDGGPLALEASDRTNGLPDHKGFFTGIRVASVPVPEPAAGTLALLGLVQLGIRQRQNKTGR